MMTVTYVSKIIAPSCQCRELVFRVPDRVSDRHEIYEIDEISDTKKSIKTWVAAIDTNQIILLPQHLYDTYTFEFISFVRFRGSKVQDSKGTKERKKKNSKNANHPAPAEDDMNNK